MEMQGNTDLMQRHTVGFLAGSKIAALSVLPVLDWATDMAKRGDVAVMSGFHSQLERDVLQFLLRGKCGIIIVMACMLYKSVPAALRPAYDAGRILFISPDGCERIPRPNRQSCALRNNYIAQKADSLVFPLISKSSSVFLLTQTQKPTLIL